ncbi:PDZ and LIM domain protein 7 isoform X1 [Hyperolius riggenbachi]|uniref:PDZ and LIM domain protein 7 isoform X1 n=1 Tax=Hyperolius riggenbachi TaxID=752182 RepID=UPI0035A26AD3
MEDYKVVLDGPAPWGFRLQGGKDFNMPLSISRLTPAGKAELTGVNVGDWLLQIDGESTTNMTHIEAQNKIRAAGNKLSLALSRFSLGLSNQPKGVLTPDTQGVKYNFSPSTALNKTARPFGAGTPPPGNSWPAQVTKTVTYNPPPPSYSNNQTSRAQHLNGQDSRNASTKYGQDVMDFPPPPPPPPSTGPAVRPPWTTDASFAERYAPDKTTTVMTKHSQPATLTPVQNRSSILQAAQPAPSGEKTPICSQCNKVIRGRYLLALGRYYHPEEFTCSQCHKVVEEGGFFEEKGSIFCPRCYDVRFAPNCAKCKKKITGEIMHALKMTWHVQCFTCAFCKTPIRNRAFYMEDGQPYCEKDYEKMFGTKCRGCDFKIDAGDRFLEALGFSWHDTCFVCAICQCNLEGKTFYSKKDKPLCKTHAFSNV